MSEPALTPETLTSERLRQRKIVNRTMEVIATLAALAAVAVLVLVVAAVAKRGFEALNVDFFTKDISFLGSLTGQETHSGIKNAIVGSVIIVGFAILMALPVGILAAIYLNELAPPRLRVPLTLALDVLNGIPAIVIGIFVYVLLVLGSGQSALKASFGLAILMLPLVARSTQEVLALIPNSMREASLALGAAKWRTTLSIVLPQAVGGIITGATLATARVAGETAPLLFTSSSLPSTTSWNPHDPLPSMPLFIFSASENADPAIQAQGWGTALVLMAFVLIASVIARAVGLRSRRKLTGKR
jgi:phosphate transport system permease protein